MDGDQRPELAAARDEWLASPEGLNCQCNAILSWPPFQPLLTQRLEKAFEAGAAAKEAIIESEILGNT